MCGRLSCFLKLRFNTLYVSDSKDCSYENTNSGWKLRDEPHLWKNIIDVAREFLLADGGKSLQALVVGTGIYNWERDGVNLIDDFLNSCPNGTSLSISEIDSTYYMTPETSQSSWVRKFGSQLEKLELHIYVPNSFPMHFTALRELVLSREPAEMEPTDLWRKIGCSLEKLVVPIEHLSLSFDYRTDTKDARQVMEVGAEGTKCVETLMYSGPLFHRDRSNTFFRKERSFANVYNCAFKSN